jgi:hypothetical protein
LPACGSSVPPPVFHLETSTLALPVEPVRSSISVLPPRPTVSCLSALSAPTRPPYLLRYRRPHPRRPARKNAYGLRRSDPDGGAARTGGGGGGEGGMVGKAGGGDGRRNAATPLGDRLPAPAQQHRSHQF